MVTIDPSSNDRNDAGIEKIPEIQKSGELEHRASQGSSAYGKLGKSESFDDWQKRKEEKRSGGAKKVPAKQLRSSGGLKRGRLNPISKKQKKKNLEYAKAKKEFYSKEDNQWCAICGQTTGLSIHHTEKRIGGNLADQSTFLTLCLTSNFLNDKHPELNQSASGCHGFVESNKGWARLNGFLK